MLQALELTRLRFRDELQEALDEMFLATEFEERARLRGKISGVFRRYRAELLVDITSWVIQRTPNAEPTKFLVSRWQKLTFQRSLSNNRLAKLWCDSGRKPGDRGAFDVPKAVTTLAIQAFSIYSPALDAEPDLGQVELLSAAVLEHELNL